jgi:hypothetical protein
MHENNNDLLPDLHDTQRRRFLPGMAPALAAGGPAETAGTPGSPFPAPLRDLAGRTACVTTSSR